MLVRDAAGAWLQHRGLELRVEDRTRAAPSRTPKAGRDGTLRASMNGRVVAVAARIGDRAESGAPLVTLEAMKMEHVHVAPRAGIVRAVQVTSGQQVAAGSVLVELDGGEAPAAYAAMGRGRVDRGPSESDTAQPSSSAGDPAGVAR